MKHINEIVEAIPAGTTSVAFLGRHTHSVQEGPQFTRTITPEGIELCKKVQPFYTKLFTELAERFGNPTYFRSQFIRSALTIWEITHAAQITEDSHLNIVDGASLKTINNGTWHKEHRFDGDGKERPVPEVLKDFFADTTIDKSGPFDDYRKNYLAWADGVENEKFRIAFAHEIGCSLAAGPHLPKNVAPGLEECEGYLICFDADGNIFTAIKVIPY